MDMHSKCETAKNWLHGGHVSKCYQFWHSICTDRKILKHVGGITIPFVTEFIHQDKQPREIHFSDWEHEFVRTSLRDLVDTGCIVELPAPKAGWHSNIFLRPKKSGKFRIILNLKPLNKLIEYRKFKMPNIYTVMNMVKKGDSFISLDLSNAYSSLRIRDKDCRFLQFSFEGRHYMYTILLNGIAIGPWVFVEVTQALTCYLCKWGVNMVIYIDDTLLINMDPDRLVQQSGLAQSVFKNAGFVINFWVSQLTQKNLRQN